MATNLTEGTLAAVGRAEAPALRRGLPLLGAVPWAGLYFVAYVAVFYTGADVFLRREGWSPVRPTLLFFTAALPLVAPVVWRDLRRPASRALTLLRENLALLLPLVALAGLAFAGSLLPAANWSQGGKFVLYPTYTLAGVVAAMLTTLSPEVARFWRPAVAAAFALLAATIAVDVVAPGTFAKHMSRAAGLVEDPNTAAFLVVLAAALLVDPRRSRLADVALLGVAAGAVLCTLSRGGLALLVLLAVALPVLPLLRGRAALRRRPLWLAGAGIALLALGALAVAGLAAADFGMFGRPSARDRVAQITSGAPLGSQEDRFTLLGDYLDLVAARPLFGHGTGFSHSLPRGPHNRFVSQWVNLGLPGLLAYAACLAAAFRLFQRRRSDCGMLLVLLLAGFSLLHHLVLEIRGVMLALGLVAGLTSPSVRGGR